ncbi:hypothetical protein BDB01DRAFT_337855 [Pilobolus umbonatus]|nr:hypothetical protein BDB01DRAFT_337855 [Pilobolus umbonatus]
MTSSVSKEKFIRTLRHYLEVNENRLLAQPDFSLPTASNTIQELPEELQEKNGLIKAVSSLWSGPRPSNTTPINRLPNGHDSSSISSKPTSLYGIPIPYMSLLAATSPNVTSLSNTLYMPIRSSLTLDIHHLYFLLVQFDYFGLESFHLPIPEDGLVETETSESAGTTPSIVSSVGSVASTMSLSTGWQFWSKQSNKQERPLHDDIRYIHRYLSRVSALKLHMSLLTDTQNGVTRSGQRAIYGYERPIPQDGTLLLPLNTFKHLSYLELSHIHPSMIASWSDLQQCLVSLVIKSANIDNATDIIGTTPWPRLKMLSLADNSLTTLDNEPSLKIGSVTHLNLSSNLLIDAPASLSNLYNLSSLNLSHNMISYTSGINVVLGNIQELDLRGNRLTVLAGLDRLWALERLDVRDNRIDDAAEIGRLTALPNIHDIWVEGNPFTKIQPDYRVNIFNRFKKCDLDIELDGTKPTFTERLRIQSQPHHHQTNSIPAATVMTEHLGDPKRYSTGNIPTPRSMSENPPKAKKLGRAKTKDSKRIIRLGQKDKPEPPAAIAAKANEENNNDTRHHVHRLADLEQSVQEDIVSARRATSMKSRRSKSSADDSAIKAKESISESTRNTSAAFRRKIEAMRKEAGTEWLRVLQEMDVVQQNKADH